VDQVPVEAVVASNGSTRRISIPGKKALVNKLTGLVLGVVSRDYRVVTNQEAVNLARDVCEKAFPGLSSVEWEAKRASAPSTLSYAFIDLMHKTHVLNYWDSEIKKNDPFRPHAISFCCRFELVKPGEQVQIALTFRLMVMFD
jgi:hypothetical protein